MILKQGDCLELMKKIEDCSVDMILCDLPYGVTKNKWDSVIPFESLWEQYSRIIKENGAIILFGQDKFTAKVMLSNEKMHRYNIIWDKISTTGFLNANRMPLRSHEDICVFYKKLPVYNPQKYLGEKSHSKGSKKRNTNNNYGEFTMVDNTAVHGEYKFPKSIISFPRVPPSKIVHPTQKPVDLLEYIIKTYSNENETVLDNCMGSGSTGVAAVNIGRKFYGIELDENYFKIAESRIQEAVCLKQGTPMIKPENNTASLNESA